MSNLLVTGAKSLKFYLRGPELRRLVLYPEGGVTQERFQQSIGWIGADQETWSEAPMELVLFARFLRNYNPLVSERLFTYAEKLAIANEI